MREIHGNRDCPYAWRVRIVAREKELPFEWVPADADGKRKSPTLVEDGFELRESVVIMQYLDEAYAGKPLQALGARDRAQMRLRMCDLMSLEREADFAAACEALDRMLGDDRAWLGGSGPDLSDVNLWPFLARFEQRIPAGLKRVTAYWGRVKDRDSFTSTRPR